LNDSAAALSALVPTAPRDLITPRSLQTRANSFEVYLRPDIAVEHRSVQAADTAGGRRFERVGDQFGAHVIGDGPARRPADGRRLDAGDVQ
jgi:hypothetical protein